MACDSPSRKVKNQIRRVGELQIDRRPLQADHRGGRSTTNSGVCLTRTGEELCWQIGAGANSSSTFTLLDGPAVRVCSSYAATFSHVATTAWVGVNLASGNPRCTSWMIRWMNEWIERMSDKRKGGIVQWMELEREQSRAPVKNRAKWNHKSPIVQMERICQGFWGLNWPAPLCSGHWAFQSPDSKSVPVLQWCQCLPEMAPPPGSLWGSHHRHTAFPWAGPGLRWCRWWPPKETPVRSSIQLSRQITCILLYACLATLCIITNGHFNILIKTNTFKRSFENSVNVNVSMRQPLSQEHVTYHLLCYQLISTLYIQIYTGTTSFSEFSAK